MDLKKDHTARKSKSKPNRNEEGASTRNPQRTSHQQRKAQQRQREQSKRPTSTQSPQAEGQRPKHRKPQSKASNKDWQVAKQCKGKRAPKTILRRKENASIAPLNGVTKGSEARPKQSDKTARRSVRLSQAKETKHDNEVRTSARQCQTSSANRNEDLGVGVAFELFLAKVAVLGRFIVFV